MYEVMPQSQVEEWVDGIAHDFSKAKDLDSLLDSAVDVFSLDYVETLKKAAWPVFKQWLKKFQPEPKTVAVFDYPAYFYARYAVSGPDPDIGNAIARRIAKDTEKIGADSAVIAVDCPSGTGWRSSFYKDYKADRPAKPDGFYQCREESLKQLPDMVSCLSWESDDVMASVAFRCKMLGHRCVIMTEDKDLLQCVGMGTTCFSPKNNQARGEDYLKAQYKVTPRQFIDWLCLSGKDNVPSAAGIGEGRASDFLQKFGSVISMFDSREKLTEKKREAIEKYVYSGDYFTARRLHTLCKNLKVRL